MIGRSIVRGAAFAAAIVLASGCTTSPTRPGEEPAGQDIAIAGASVGIATGNLTAEMRRRAMFGTGMNPISGDDAAGYYMDQLEERLRQPLRRSGVSIVRHGNNITLKLPGDRVFVAGEAEIEPRSNDTLHEIIRALREYEKTLIEVAGHTDDSGSAEANLELSKLRADVLAGYMIPPLDIRRIVSEGYGQEHPIADNRTDEGRARNNRMELTLVPFTR